MANRTVVAFTFVVAFCLAGCSNLAKNYLPEPVFKGESKQADSLLDNDGYVDLEKYKTERSKIKEDAEAASKRKALREKLISTALYSSNAKCEMHKATIMSNSNNVNLFAGSAALLFSGYATVVDSVQTAKSASALATFSTGMQGQFNQEIYQSKLSTAIFKAIDIAREKQESKLLATARDGSASDETLVYEISKYHEKCSLLVALTEITDGLARVDSAAQVSEKIKVLKAVKLSLSAEDKTSAAKIDERIVELEIEMSKK